MSIQNNWIGWVIIGIVVVFIIAINISLISALKNKSINKPMDISKSVFDRAKSPWKPEDDALIELSKMVEDISPDQNNEQQKKVNS
jgi:hypothetical protein